MSISAQAFSEILEFGEAKDALLTTYEPATRIKSREQAWLLELCKSLGISKQVSEEMKRPYPRFLPKRSLKRGGEAFLVLAYDQWRNSETVLLKVPLPRFTLDKTEEHRIDPAPAPGPVRESKQAEPAVVKGFSAMMAIAKQMCSPGVARKKKEKAEPLYEARKDRYDNTYSFTRFKRSFILQKQLHDLSRREGGDLGYIPNVYEYTEPPFCFYSMEFIEASDFLDFVKSHSDEENFLFFLRLVEFIEKVLHGYGVAHCDLAPRNILVRNSLPIILDFGIAKAANLADITAPGQQMGSVLMSSPTQLTEGRHRGYQDDIFSLGRLLWILLCRRIPSTDYIVAREVDGKIEFDHEAVSALFDVTALPTKFRDIYRATQEFEYEDISDFRSALEGLLCLKPQSITCQEKCKYVIEIEARLQKLSEILLMATPPVVLTIREALSRKKLEPPAKD